MKNPIIGAGGGGKGGGGGASTPTEQPDNLHSASYVRVIDLLCEGEIEGLATGDLKSVFLDETPIQADDGSFNFKDLKAILRKGTPLQGAIAGFQGVEQEIVVGTEIKKDDPIVRRINNPEVNQVRVTISTPTLFQVNSENGDTNGTEVAYQIELKSDGGSYSIIKKDKMAGKTTTKYQRAYDIDLKGNAPWDIRVTRLTDDSTKQTLQNATWWDGYTEIIDAKLKYPNTAYVAFSVNSKQFRSIPARAYRLKLLRIKIPANATVRADGSLTYSGTWDGTFKIAWSSNPAWCFYDLITNERYGLGNYIANGQIDKWSLYQIGKYCDELVSDGNGGFEPRFRCNVFLQDREEAFKVIQNFAAIFRGMAYWASGSLTATQDRPSDPVAIYTNANVEGGLFQKSGTSLKTRHTVALVSWNDPQDFCRLKIEYVEDAEAIAKYGLIETEVLAFGCTSQGQAHRLGKWILYSENYETQTIAFKTGLDGVLARPGEIITIQDKHSAGIRLSGRIKGPSVLAPRLDKAVSYNPAHSYRLSVMLPDGTLGTSDIDRFEDGGEVVVLSSPLKAPPVKNAIWMIESNQISSQLFRMISIGDASDGTYEITALEYNASKYDYVEKNTALVKPNISLLNQSPTDPKDFVISERLYEYSGQVLNLVEVGWTASDRAVSYDITYTRNGGNKATATALMPYFDIPKALPGEYKFSIFAVSQNGKRSKTVNITKRIFGKTSPPADVQDFTLTSLSDGVAHLTWEQATDLDVKIGGSVRIRHTADTSGSAKWEDAVDIGPRLSGITTATTLPALTGTYFAKFIDSSGKYSENPAKFSTTIPTVLSLNLVGHINEDGDGFIGYHHKTFITDFAGLPAVTLGGNILMDDMPKIDSLPTLDFYGGTANYGYYRCHSPYDLGKSMTCILTSQMTVQAVNRSDMIDSRDEPVDSWSVIDGEKINGVNAVLQVRTTNDDPNASPTWSAWQKFHTGNFKARGFDFRVVLTSDNKDHNIIVKTLKVHIDMPDYTLSQGGITTGTSAYVVTFPNSFFATPVIGITAQDMDSGDRYTITALTKNGFTITFRNSGGTIISRTFDYLAKGYGYQ